MGEKSKKDKIVNGVITKAAETSKKGAMIAANVMEKTASGSKIVAGEIVKGAKDMSQKAKIDSYNRKMKKYNPLFPKEYRSDEFFVPNIICIVDDAVRRDVDVCKGAIGWRENKKETEVLFLYDEFVAESGLTFVPSAVCDEFYYIDSFDRHKFIKLDCIFQKAHEEKVAELEHIAYSLGAKNCSIEIEEKEMKHAKRKRKTDTEEKYHTVKAIESYDTEATSDSIVRYISKSETSFKGNNDVVVPNLKWFAHDDNILNLIKYRCNGQNEITSKILVISGSSCSTMSRKAAYAVDVAVTCMGAGQSYAMEDKSIKETLTNIVYRLEF